MFFWKSSLVLILTYFPPRWGVCQRIVECHHIPGWQSRLDIAEVQALARAACGEETGTGSQGISAHLLPERARGAIIYYLHWCEMQPLSLRRHIVLRSLLLAKFPSQVCLFGPWTCTGGIFPRSLCLIHRSCSSSQIIFHKAAALQTASRSFQLCFISYLSFCSVEAASAGLHRKV